MSEEEEERQNEGDDEVNDEVDDEGDGDHNNEPVCHDCKGECKRLVDDVDVLKRLMAESATAMRDLRDTMVPFSKKVVTLSEELVGAQKRIREEIDRMHNELDTVNRRSSQIGRKVMEMEKPKSLTLDEKIAAANARDASISASKKMKTGT